MKILIPQPHFGTSGGARVLSELATAWTAAGNHVDMLVPRTAGQPYFPTTARLLRTDLRGTVLNATGPRHTVRSGIYNNLALCAGLSKIGPNYDIILANHNLTAWATWLARVPRRSRFYYIQAYEPTFCLDPLAPTRYLLARLSYHLPLTQIVNASVYPGLEDRPVVPCGIDLNIFYPTKRRFDFSHDHPIILGTIGRTEPWKGTRYVLEAFERLYQTDSRYRLRVAFGNLPTDWSHPAAEIVPIDNDVKLADFYRSLDILVAGTYGQNDSPHYPVLEAMACGIPTVSTGYLPGTEKNSWIYAAKDVHNLVSKITSVISDDKLEEKIALARSAANEFAWPLIAKRLENIFIEALALPSPR